MTAQQNTLMKKASGIIYILLVFFFMLKLEATTANEKKIFARLDLVNNKTHKAEAILLSESSSADVWIYKKVLDKRSKTQKERLYKDANKILKEFEDYIIPKTKQIIDSPAIFGPIHIILDDIKDKSNTTIKNSPTEEKKDKKVHGFYSPNYVGKNVLILDINYKWRGIKSLYSILAHEFYHYIQYHYDQDEEDFVKEGTAQVIEKLLYDHLHLNTVSNYFKEANNQLSSFDNTKSDYANSYLFFNYMITNFTTTSFLKEILLEPLDGITGIDEVLKRNAIDFYGQEINFSTLFQLYSIALTTNAGQGFYNLPNVLGMRINSEKLNQKMIAIKPHSSRHFQFTTADIDFINSFYHEDINSYYVGLTKDGKIKAIPTSHGLTTDEFHSFQRLSWTIINTTKRSIQFSF